MIIDRVRFFIDRKTLFFIIMLFFLEKPVHIYYTAPRPVQLLLTATEMAVYVYIFLVWLGKKRISGMLIMTSLLFGIVVLSTVFNGGDYIGTIRNTMCYVFMVMLTDNECDDLEHLWKACIVYMSVMIFINFVSILMFPQAMRYNEVIYQGVSYRFSPQWFYSTKNGLGKHVLYLLFFKADYDYKKYSKLQPSFYIIALVGWISLILVWSATSIVTVFTMIVLLICGEMVHRLRPGIFNVYLLMGIMAAFFVLFVLANNSWIFSDFLVNVLKKNVTFNGRTTIWAGSVESILTRPVLGYGDLQSEEYRNLIGHAHASDSHNYLLTLGINGGFIAMILFVVIIIMVVRVIRSRQYEFCGITLTAFVFSFFMMMIFENTTTKLLWVILSYVFYLRKDDRVKAGLSQFSEKLNWHLTV